MSAETPWTTVWQNERRFTVELLIAIPWRTVSLVDNDPLMMELFTCTSVPVHLNICTGSVAGSVETSSM